MENLKVALDLFNESEFSKAEAILTSLVNNPALEQKEKKESFEKLIFLKKMKNKEGDLLPIYMSYFKFLTETKEPQLALNLASEIKKDSNFFKNFEFQKLEISNFKTLGLLDEGKRATLGILDYCFSKRLINLYKIINPSNYLYDEINLSFWNIRYAIYTNNEEQLWKELKVYRRLNKKHEHLVSVRQEEMSVLINDMLATGMNKTAISCFNILIIRKYFENLKEFETYRSGKNNISAEIKKTILKMLMELMVLTNFEDIKEEYDFFTSNKLDHRSSTNRKSKVISISSEYEKKKKLEKASLYYLDNKDEKNLNILEEKLEKKYPKSNALKAIKNSRASRYRQDNSDPDEIYQGLLNELKGFASQENQKDEFSYISKQLVEELNDDEHVNDLFYALWILGDYNSILDLLDVKSVKVDQQSFEDQINFLYLRLRCLQADKKHHEVIQLSLYYLRYWPMSQSERMNFYYICAESYFSIKDFKNALRIYVDLYQIEPNYRLVQLRIKEIAKN